MNNPITAPTEAPMTAAHLVASELAEAGSRTSIPLAEGFGILEAGTVVGRIEATNYWGPYDPAATDGRETAAGILATTEDTTAAPAPAVALTRAAVVHAAALTGADTQSLDQLRALDVHALPAH